MYPWKQLNIKLISANNRKISPIISTVIKALTLKKYKTVAIITIMAPNIINVTNPRMPYIIYIL